MVIAEQILELVRIEQLRQKGRFVPEDESYLQKIFARAELVHHSAAGECAGFSFFYCNDPERRSSYITLLAVAPKWRNKGIGAALVQEVLTVTQRRGFKYCELEVGKENVAAQKLYESMGFEIVEVRDEKYLMQASVEKNVAKA